MDHRALVVRCFHCNNPLQVVNRVTEMTCIDVGRIILKAARERHQVGLEREHIFDSFCHCKPQHKYEP
jgi:hypothetical protein